MPINNISPTLIIKKAILSQGFFPFRGDDGGGGAEYFGIGHIRMFGFNFVPGSHVDANGTIIGIAPNTALFSILGTTYGGDGRTTFAAPDFTTRISAGFGQGPGLSFDTLGEIDGSDTVDFERAELPTLRGGSGTQVDNEQQTLTVNYSINAAGIFPSQGGGGGAGVPNFIGVISEFAGNFAPNDQIPCDGRLLSIAEFTALYVIIGTTYGGDGQTTFAVPDLRGRNAVGTGTPPGGSNTVIIGEAFGTETAGLSVANLPVAMGGSGTPVSNYGPSLGLTYLVATSGVFPSQGGGGTGENVYLGELILFAGNFAPSGFAIAQGQLLSINSNSALFALLGTQYGGDGITTFALPDMRGRSPANSGDFPVGTQFGTQTYTVGIEEFGALDLTGTGGSDALYGANQNDIINGAEANDTLFGNGGADQIDGGTGADAMNGGEGDDRFAVDDVGDTVIGGNGIDLVNVSAASFTLADDTENLTYTGSGAFAGFGGNTANTITGGALDDVLKGRAGDDVLDGGSGIDTLVGGAGLDTLNGGEGNDNLTGGAGIDTLNGGNGNDRLVVEDSGDVANGGDGIDTVEVAAAISYTIAADVEIVTNTSGGAVSVTLNDLANTYGGGAAADTAFGQAGNDILYGRGGDDLLLGGDDIDRLFGDVGQDSLNGQAGNDLLYGGGDGDQLVGGSGNDTLYGEAGSDSIDGGSGVDQLYGGAGGDVFTFNNGDSGATLATADFIRDYSRAQGDFIALQRIDAIAGGGNDAFSFIGTSAFSNVAGQLRYEVVGGETRVLGDIDGNGVADVMIRIIGGHTLTTADFTL